MSNYRRGAYAQRMLVVAHRVEWNRVIIFVMVLLNFFNPSIAQAQNGNTFRFFRDWVNQWGNRINPARPFGLDIIGPVRAPGSDARSGSMTGENFSSIIDLYTQRITYPEVDSQLVQLDPSRISLQTDYDARVYFTGLSGSYNNTLGLNTSGYGVGEGDPVLIAPYTRANSRDREFDRRRRQELTDGEFVDIGTLRAGSPFDLFLISNGGNGGRDVFSSNALINADGFQHLMAFALPDSPYLLLGFEDLYGGGDKNFLDMVFALDVGQENIQALVMAANPEPAEYALIATFLIVGWHAARKRRLNEQVNSQAGR